jgi:hypothetical protein
MNKVADSLFVDQHSRATGSSAGAVRRHQAASSRHHNIAFLKTSSESDSAGPSGGGRFGRTNREQAAETPGASGSRRKCKIVFFYVQEQNIFHKNYSYLSKC